MQNYHSMNLIDSTTTYASPKKYKKWEVNELINFIYKAKTEKEAINNIHIILNQYKKRIPFWTLIKLIFSK